MPSSFALPPPAGFKSSAVPGKPSVPLSLVLARGLQGPLHEAVGDRCPQLPGRRLLGSSELAEGLGKASHLVPSWSSSELLTCLLLHAVSSTKGTSAWT